MSNSGVHPDRSADHLYRVHLWHKSGSDIGYRDLGIVEVTLHKGYLVDDAGEILFLEDETMRRAMVDKVSRVQGQLMVHATKL